MKHKFFSFSFLISSYLLIIAACCNESDSNSGLIISKLDIDYINYTLLDIPDTSCIRSDSSYKILVVDISEQSNLPYINFDKYSILTNLKLENGRIFCDRIVTVDSLNKTVTYTVKTKSCKCMDKCDNSDYNMVLVPKIGNDYKVIFK